ncbi:serine/threonine-protein kinase [Nocardia canadensis]|uniref:serine/threonine-protein kinase n=2 Tax=Nocardia TaxID=1817 RepID=UPI00292E2841|nr:serine/threonine-protein kinase [Nocardia canadensis]
MTARLRPGSVFAGYVIERVLGSGGMGTVYAARHPRLPRLDAIKVLSEAHSGAPEFRARFIREAELAARIDHPNVVAVHDRGLVDGALWIAMQYVAGTDAAAVLRAGVPRPEHALHIVTEAAAGLDAAHRAGLLHRDVKPANLMLERRPGEPDRVLVADFGIAKSGTDSTALTETGAFLATLAYAAPELIRLDAVDHRADLYSLGCTLFELLTGRTPFPRDTVAAVINAHLTEPPPRPTQVNPGLPPAIDAVIARAMAKNPDDRYSSCGALAAAAAAAFGAPVAPTARVAGPGTPRGPIGHPGPAAGTPPTGVPVGHSWAPTPSPRAVTAPVSRRRLLAAGAVAGLTLALVAAGAVALNRDESPAAAPTTSAAPTTAAESAWGAHEYIVRALPELLPRTPFASGYQGARCAAVDKEHRPIALDQHDGVGRLSCNGDRDPVERMTVYCNGDRTPSNARPFVEATEIREENWERSSGRGRLIVQNMPGLRAGTTSGALVVQFDDPARNFCLVSIIGATNGAELYDRWWPTAPF